MKRNLWNLLGGAAFMLLLWTAAASDAGNLPIWRAILQAAFSGLGMLACRLVPRAQRHRRMPRGAVVTPISAPHAEPMRAQM